MVTEDLRDFRRKISFRRNFAVLVTGLLVAVFASDSHVLSDVALGAMAAWWFITAATYQRALSLASKYSDPGAN